MRTAASLYLQNGCLHLQSIREIEAVKKPDSLLHFSEHYEELLRVQKSSAGAYGRLRLRSPEKEASIFGYNKLRYFVLMNFLSSAPFASTSFHELNSRNSWKNLRRSSDNHPSNEMPKSQCWKSKKVHRQMKDSKASSSPPYLSQPVE